VQAQASAESGEPAPKSDVRRAAARCWALLLVRIYECLPLSCPKCGEPMRIIAFVLDRPTIERILDHIGESMQPPKVLPARSPPNRRGSGGGLAGGGGACHDRRVAGGEGVVLFSIPLIPVFWPLTPLAGEGGDARLWVSFANDCQPRVSGTSLAPVQVTLARHLVRQGLGP